VFTTAHRVPFSSMASLASVASGSIASAPRARGMMRAVRSAAAPRS